ncbi:MAG: BolA/IbaG family iron-sulfur metabolism protein [Rickettsiales bacterium]|nr:BolA/IbaG family iron-sulfur metabolism protein [Rickettsiales bacterium]
MPADKNTLHNTLSEAFPEAEISLKSLTGDDDHWEVTIADKAFSGINRISQHRLVQNSIKHLNIHAVSIKTNPIN